LNLSDLEAIGAKATDQFRLEALPQYLVPQEDDDFDAWKRGSRELPTPDTSPWLAHIRDTTDAGVRWSRVRILDYPLATYSEFELHGYQANAAAGESIYVADRQWYRGFDGFRDDFWIFDHEIVVRMIYDAEGHFIRPELAEDSRPYQGMRSIALRHSVALGDFLSRHEPRLIA
jgi:hypothetical protein